MKLSVESSLRVRVRVKVRVSVSVRVRAEFPEMDGGVRRLLGFSRMDEDQPH